MDQDKITMKNDTSDLIEEVISLRRTNHILRELLQREGKLPESLKDRSTNKSGDLNDKLTNGEILRYSRQLLVPEISVEGQENLKRSSVIVIGAGGLGCPVIMYLAAGGIGKLGIVDGDFVDIGNLHRQIIHDEFSVGLPKAISAKAAVYRLAKSCECIAYQTILTARNALEILSRYDVIVDASDNAATRYLVNDAAVLLKKPLVSACVLRTQGQLTVYNFENGPCYRCLHPSPPNPGVVMNCSDGGVVNAVPGILGSLQALETIKLCSNMTRKLLTFNGTNGEFEILKLRNRRLDCDICGESPKIKRLIDYTSFCGSEYSDKCRSLNVLDSAYRITPKEYSIILSKKVPHLLIDVRDKLEYKICKLNGSINIPLYSINKNINVMEDALNGIAIQTSLDINSIPIYFVCRRGNQSQLALQMVKCLKNTILNLNPLKDISGGLQNWTETVDPKFPIY